MFYRLLANAVVVFHGLFIAFIVFGGILAWHRPWVALVHFPSAVWGVLIEYNGWICPLTPLENSLRLRAGQEGYSGGFIEHYLLPAIYPAELTARTQGLLGSAVLVVNVVVYAVFLRRLMRGS